MFLTGPLQHQIAPVYWRTRPDRRRADDGRPTPWSPWAQPRLPSLPNLDWAERTCRKSPQAWSPASGLSGGGVIMKRGASVQGINSAATLWATASIGLAIGRGFNQLALLLLASTTPACAPVAEHSGASSLSYG